MASTKTKSGLPQRIAMWSATHPWRAIGLWAVAVVATCGIGLVQAPRQASQVEIGVGESGRALQMAQDAGHADPAVESVLITAHDGSLDIQQAKAAAVEVRSALSALDVVGGIQAPVTAADGSAVLVQTAVTGDPDTADERVPALQRAVGTIQRDHPDLRVEQVGPASIAQDFKRWLDKDLSKATSLSLPVTLGILLLAFGAIVMAGIPVLLAITSVASALGLWALASQLVPDPGMVLHLLVLIGMAVGVDYSLFYLRRFREELHAGQDDASAIRVAAATAGHSVVVSGCAVILAMAGLYLAQDSVFAAMATGSIIVVTVALVSSLTVLPALLAQLGRWADRPRVPVLWRLSNGSTPRVVPALTRPVVSHPVLALVAVVAVLLGMAFPLLSLSLKATQVEDYPRSLTTMVSYDRLVSAFPNNAATDVVTVRVPAAATGELTAQVRALTVRTAQHPDLFGTVVESWRSPDRRTAVVRISVPHSLASTQARSSVAVLRSTIVPQTLARIVGADAAVGGDVAADMDYTHNLDRTLPLVVSLVLLLTFLMMFATYRSLAVAAITVVLNLLSMAAAFGLLALVFQGTWAEGVLGFTSAGHVVSWVPMLLFVVLSGLSLDYHVFVVSRIRENAINGMLPREAIFDGVVRTAGVVTSAALVMIAVFSIFGALSFIELKQIGVGLALGIALDATLIRVVALPAMMLVCRNVLWWPGNRAVDQAVTNVGR